MQMENLLHTLRRKRQTESDLVLVLNEVRMYLEDNKLSAQYPVLRFYCDWFFHLTLDRNLYAPLIIGEINRYLFDTSIMHRKGLPLGEELTYGMRMREMVTQLVYMIYKITGKQVIVSPTFWMMYFRYIAKRKVITHPLYLEKVINSRMIYRSAKDIQKAIQDGNVFTNDRLKYMSSSRLDPSFDYSKPVPIWVNNMQVLEVAGNTVVFELYDNTRPLEDRFTVVYQMQFPAGKQPAFTIVE